MENHIYKAMKLIGRNNRFVHNENNLIIKRQINGSIDKDVANRLMKL